MSFLEDVGGMGRVSATLLRHRLVMATAGTAAAVIVAGGAFAVTSHHSSGSAQAGGSGNPGTSGGGGAPAPSASPSAASAASAAPAAPLSLLSASPAGGAKHANGGAAITLKFSSALSPSTPLPKLSPSVAGHWKVSGATATFTPTSGFLPDTKVTLKIPGGEHGMAGAAATAGTLKKAATVKFKTGAYSTLRLQQILAQLGYLPLSWKASGAQTAASVPAGAPAASGGGLNKQVTDAYDPPAGKFTVKPGYPSQLTSQWKVGQDNMLDQGAIRAFQSDEGLDMDGVAGPEVWSALLTAAAKGKSNPNGYTYALANQAEPQTLTVWHNGKVVEKTQANTGVAGAGTADGTYPVYLRYQQNYMDGTNVDGTKYHDLIYWISYFNGGDAVHYYDRYSYGYYQSNGCVEVPLDAARTAWGYMTYGTLVTVEGPEA